MGSPTRFKIFRADISPHQHHSHCESQETTHMIPQSLKIYTLHSVIILAYDLTLVFLLQSHEEGSIRTASSPSGSRESLLSVWGGGNQPRESIYISLVQSVSRLEPSQPSRPDSSHTLCGRSQQVQRACLCMPSQPRRALPRVRLVLFL